MEKQHYKLMNLLLLIVISACMVQLYIHSVYPVYYYYGYQNAFNESNAITSMIVFFISLFGITFARLSNFIYGICLVFFIFSLVPNLILYAYMNTPVMIIVGIVCLLFFLIVLSKVNLSFPIKQLYTKNTPTYFISASLILAFPFLFVFGFGFSSSANLLSGGELDVRLTARGIDNLYTGYVSNWLVNIICPILMVIGVWKKNYKVLMLACFIMFYIFTCYGTKSVFLSIPLVIGLAMFKYQQKLFLFCLALATLLFFTTFILPSEGVPGLFKGIFANRLFFVPALNTVFYFEFFQGEPLYLSSNILKGLGEYPFSEAPSFIIGDKYYDQEGMSANNGLPADGYMNFGDMGVIVYSFITALIFAFFNSLKLNHRFFGMFVIISFNLIMTALTTVLITHGVVLFYILCLFLFKNSVNTPALESVRK